MSLGASHSLQKQFRELTKNPIPGFRVSLKDDDMFHWKVGIVGPPDTIYAGGYFEATLSFPSDFPFQPPAFQFDHSIFHPNIFIDGKLCISILHPPGDDAMSGETAEERWNPTQSVESILVSIVSLLSDPNVSSPANIDAAVMYRNNRKEYERIILDQVEKSKENIPQDMIIPTTVCDFKSKKPQESDVEEDHDFWVESEEEEEEDDDDELSE